MEEALPVVAGVVVGLVAQRVDWVWPRALLIVMFAIAFGAWASWFNGELQLSWVYLVIDTAQILAASVITLLLVRTWHRAKAWRGAR
jgi:hypothetical protein